MGDLLTVLFENYQTCHGLVLSQLEAFKGSIEQLMTKIVETDMQSIFTRAQKIKQAKKKKIDHYEFNVGHWK